MPGQSEQAASAPAGYLDIQLAELNRVGGAETAREISQQPELWEKTLELISARRFEIDRFLNKAYSTNGLEVILAGAGTSAFIGNILHGYFQKNTGKCCTSIATTDLLTHPELYFYGKNILLISFARSGNSPESLATVNLANHFCEQAFHLIITCNPRGQLATIKPNSSSLIFLLPPEAEDLSVAMTGSFTSMLLAGLLISRIHELPALENQMRQLMVYGTQCIKKYTATLREIAALDFDRAVFLGSGPLQGVAQESGLKLQEFTGGRVICAQDSFLGFRHGPRVVITASTLIIYLFSNEPYVHRYETDLVHAVNQGEHGLYQLGISESPLHEPGLDQNLYFASGQSRIDEEFLAVCSVLPAQLIGFFKAIQLGLKPDNPVEDGTITRVVEGVTIYPKAEPEAVNR
jgi:tagatose-6-phosphate ketose/aldose isomerase